MKKTILMLEHDDDDRYIVEQVFKERDYSVVLEFYSNSFEFLEHLKGKKGQHSPSMILMNFITYPIPSLDVLKALKSDPAYSHIPVVILAGTLTADAVAKCYATGANSVIQKPDSDAGTYAKIDNFMEYWFKTVSLV